MVLLTFKAPTHPLSENESRRLHWAARSRRLKPWATVTAAAWRVADQKDRDTLLGQRINVQVSIGFARSGRRDPHNYVSTVVKTIVDALITEGMAPDDTPEYVRVEEPQFVVSKDPEILVLLTPIGPVKGDKNEQANKRSS
jgi:hypothetical protein